jgi:hypothetical protein
MPKHLKATYLAEGEYLLEETRATKWYYFPGPALWVLVFAVLSYEGWGGPRHWPVTGTWNGLVTHLAKALHLDVATTQTAFAAAFSVILVVGLLWVAVRYLRWISTVYAVTSRRVIVQKGILGRDFDQIPVTQVRGVDVHQTAGQRILRYGTIRVSSEGGARVGNEDWEGIPRPFDFQKLIENATVTLTTPVVPGTIVPPR